MALTTLDPNTALIVVDLQKGIAGYPLVHPIGEVVDQTRAMLDAFRARDLPIVLVNVAGATARQAYEQGFNVTLALDAMTDLRPEAHDYSIRNVFPRLGETGTSQRIIDLLPARSA
jgi:nicotinamidase-related amidase